MVFIRRVRILVVLLFMTALGPAITRAQEVVFPAEHHPWARFPVNSWKVVRTRSEALDEKGQVANVTTTETRTTLVAVDTSSYTLRTDATVDVASRRVKTAGQTTKHGFYGETPGQAFDVRRAADASIDIDGRTVPCEVRQVVLAADTGKLISTLYYSSEVPPFILRRETALEGVADERRNSSVVEVVALDLPQRIRGELKQASYVKTTQKLPQGSKVTLEVHCDEIPGGVTAHWSSETDEAGQVVRRSTLELVEYSVASPPGQPPPMLLRRPMRAGKAARRIDR